MTRTDTRSGGAAKVLGAVLGAGALLLPASLGPRPGPWTWVAVAGVLAGWCLLVAAAGGTEDSGPVAFVRDRLGPGPARTATALYFGGFATGQAAVALGAAEFALGDSGWRAYAVAALVLGSAAAYAWCVPRGPSPAWRRLRLAAVLALAVSWRALGGPLPGPGGEGWGAFPVAVPLLFGWVGLEGAVPAVARRRALGGTLLGIALAAALYAVLAGPPAVGAQAPTPAAAAALGLGSAALCWTYCRTNLRATAARWTELTGRTRRGGLVAAGLIALGVLALGRAARWDLPVLLIGPGAATAALYTLIAVAAVRRPRPQEPTDHDHDHSAERHRVLEGAARSAR
ncbi:hypothetical protein K7B10_21390 [Streptomyces flavotricini]|uniref:Uncharacterized protein n=1 Tax=Streptomyces flavotricini TaxID=66888 RepID=A0ABS8E8I1_9ACTN|nr:hypothetical protein [Streptomyces flavotricini]MCC0097290.1 hypothetical protein [Streptomyces flavotricini]